MLRETGPGENTETYTRTRACIHLAVLLARRASSISIHALPSVTVSYPFVESSGSALIPQPNTNVCVHDVWHAPRSAQVSHACSDESNLIYVIDVPLGAMPRGACECLHGVFTVSA